jgi:hypothetical protein
MEYSNLIGEEVYCGSPCIEEFYAIDEINETSNGVEIVMSTSYRKKTINITKEDVDNFLKEEYIEFVNDSKVQVLKSCAYQQDEWVESF